MCHRILILDDMVAEVSSLKALIEKRGYHVEIADSYESFFPLFESLDPDLIFLDIDLGRHQQTGRDVLKALNQRPFFPSVIVMSAHATREHVAEIMRYPVFGYIEKSEKYMDIDKLMLQIKNAVDLSVIRREQLKQRQLQAQYAPMIFQSNAMKKVLELAVKYAQSEHPVLITGETGTGKDALAKTIHFHSPRKEKPFRAVQSDVIPKDLFESECFGYVKGAFTGAVQNTKCGFIESANGGTLFLDEIGSLSPEAQSKFLRVLENKRYHRLGDPQERESDFRLICATNMDLHEMVRQRLFRDDLFNRIHTLRIHLPPLRERLEDAPLLFDYFIRHLPDRRYNHNFNYHPDQLFDILSIYPWPGNVRELRSFCVQLLILCETIEEQSIREALNLHIHGRNPTFGTSPMDTPCFYTAVELFEKQYIEKHLKINNFNIRQTSLSIGIELSTLYKKIKKYQIAVNLL